MSKSHKERYISSHYYHFFVRKVLSGSIPATPGELERLVRAWCALGVKAQIPRERIYQDISNLRTLVLPELEEIIEKASGELEKPDKELASKSLVFIGAESGVQFKNRMKRNDPVSLQDAIRIASEKRKELYPNNDWNRSPHKYNEALRTAISQDFESNPAISVSKLRAKYSVSREYVIDSLPADYKIIHARHLYDGCRQAAAERKYDPRYLAKYCYRQGMNANIPEQEIRKYILDFLSEYYPNSKFFSAFNAGDNAKDLLSSLLVFRSEAPRPQRHGEMREIISEYYAEHPNATFTQAAAELCCAYSTISKYRKAAGFSTARASDLRKQQVKQFFEEHPYASVRGASAALGINRATIRKFCVKLGIAPYEIRNKDGRFPNTWVSDLHEQQVKQYYEEHPNATVREASAALGISHATISKFRVKLGIICPSKRRKK